MHDSDISVIFAAVITTINHMGQEYCLPNGDVGQIVYYRDSSNLIVKILNRLIFIIDNQITE